MGDYTFFILGSYVVTALVVGGLILRAVLDHRAQLRALADLESRGTRRRSSRQAPPLEHAATGQAPRSAPVDPVAAGRTAGQAAQ